MGNLSEKTKKWRVRATKAALQGRPIPPKKRTLLTRMKTLVWRLNEKDLDTFKTFLGNFKWMKQQRIMWAEMRTWASGTRVKRCSYPTSVGTVTLLQRGAKRIWVKWDGYIATTKKEKRWGRHYNLSDVINTDIQKVKK